MSAKPSKVVFGTTTIIDISEDTVASSNLLSGYTAHGSDGNEVAGACTYDADTSDANATVYDIIENKTAYVNGSKLTGNIPVRGALSGTIDDKDDAITINAGYYDGSGSVTIDSTEKSKIVAENIKTGVSILGVTGNYTGEGVPTEQVTVTPYTTSQTILPTSGYNISQVNVNAIAYTETQNAGGGLTVTIGTVDPNT